MHDHHLGRMEGTHEVLRAGHVDAGLATDGRIHHGEQGGGQVYAPDAALVGGGHEAAEVGDHPAPQADQQGLAIGGALGQVGPDGGTGLHGFAGLARWHHDGAETAQRRHGSEQLWAAMAQAVLIAEQVQGGVRPACQQAVQGGQGIGADEQGVLSRPVFLHIASAASHPNFVRPEGPFTPKERRKGAAAPAHPARSHPHDPHRSPRSAARAPHSARSGRHPHRLCAQERPRPLAGVLAVPDHRQPHGIRCGAMAQPGGHPAASAGEGAHQGHHLQAVLRRRGHR